MTLADRQDGSHRRRRRTAAAARSGRPTASRWRTQGRIGGQVRPDRLARPTARRRTLLATDDGHQQRRSPTPAAHRLVAGRQAHRVRLVDAGSRDRRRHRRSDGHHALSSTSRPPPRATRASTTTAACTSSCVDVAIGPHRASSPTASTTSTPSTGRRTATRSRSSRTASRTRISSSTTTCSRCSVADGAIRRLTATESAEYRPRWSPDGKTHRVPGHASAASPISRRRWRTRTCG